MKNSNRRRYTNTHTHTVHAYHPSTLCVAGNGHHKVHPQKPTPHKTSYPFGTYEPSSHSHRNAVRRPIFAHFCQTLVDRVGMCLLCEVLDNESTGAYTRLGWHYKKTELSKHKFAQCRRRRGCFLLFGLVRSWGSFFFVKA